MNLFANSEENAKNKQNSLQVWQISSRYSDECLATSPGDLRCNICAVLGKCDKKFFVKNHRKSEHRQAGLQRKTDPKVSKPFCGHIDYTSRKNQSLHLFQAEDIPLHKMNHPALKSLFATTGKVLPPETAAPASVAQLASQKENQNQKKTATTKKF